MLRFPGEMLRGARVQDSLQVDDVEVEGTVGDALVYVQSPVTRTTAQAYHWSEFTGTTVRVSLGTDAAYAAGEAGRPPRLTVRGVLAVDEPGE